MSKLKRNLKLMALLSVLTALTAFTAGQMKQSRTSAAERARQAKIDANVEFMTQEYGWQLGLDEKSPLWHLAADQEDVTYKDSNQANVHKDFLSRMSLHLSLLSHELGISDPSKDFDYDSFISGSFDKQIEKYRELAQTNREGLRVLQREQMFKRALQEVCSDLAKIPTRSEQLSKLRKLRETVMRQCRRAEEQELFLFDFDSPEYSNPNTSNTDVYVHDDLENIAGDIEVAVLSGARDDSLFFEAINIDLAESRATQEMLEKIQDSNGTSNFAMIDKALQRVKEGKGDKLDRDMAEWAERIGYPSMLKQAPGISSSQRSSDLSPEDDIRISAGDIGGPVGKVDEEKSGEKTSTKKPVKRGSLLILDRNKRVRQPGE